MPTARQIKANPADAAHYIKQVLAENAKMNKALLEIKTAAKVKTNSGTNAQTIFWIKDRASSALSQ